MIFLSYGRWYFYYLLLPHCKYKNKLVQLHIAGAHNEFGMRTGMHSDNVVKNYQVRLILFALLVW